MGLRGRAQCGCCSFITQLTPHSGRRAQSQAEPPGCKNQRTCPCVPSRVDGQGSSHGILLGTGWERPLETRSQHSPRTQGLARGQKSHQQGWARWPTVQIRAFQNYWPDTFLLCTEAASWGGWLRKAGPWPCEEQALDPEAKPNLTAVLCLGDFGGGLSQNSQPWWGLF